MQVKPINETQLKTLLTVPGFAQSLDLPAGITAEELNARIVADQEFGSRVIQWCAKILLISKVTAGALEEVVRHV